MNTKCPMPYSGKIASVLLAATLSLFATSAAHAEIAFRAAASATDDAGTSLTISKPAGVVSGDLMLAGIADVGASTGITGPSGWTLVRTIEDVVRQTIWSKIAGSSEPSSYTWTLSATRRICGGIVAFSGVDASSPIQVENGAVEGNQATTTHTTPTIATSGSSTWLVSLFADQRGSGTWSTWTPPSGTTERVDQHTTNANAGNSSIEINTVGPVGAGNYSHTATASGGSQYAGMEIIALNAAAPAAPPAAPSDLVATAVSSSQIDLTWTDNATDETGFEIERKTGSGGTYAQIATPGANATSFQDTGLTAATTYFYRVRAVNGSGASAWSNEASAATTGGGGGGEIAFRAAASAKADAGTSLTISKPAGVVSGDLMLAGIADVGASTGITGPSGWTLVRTIEDVVRQTTWSKIAGSSEPSSYTWTLSATRRICGGIVAFSGVDASSPIQVENGAVEGNTVTTTHTTPTIATSGSSTWLVSLFADQRGSGTWSTWTPPSGTTERVDQQTTNANAGNSSIEINTVGPVGAGNYSHTATASGGSKYAGMEIIALNAVAPAAPPAAPGDLTATAVSSGQIDLAWTDNSSNETGFKIERKTGSGGTYSQIATVGADVVSYSDTGLIDATTYFYRVRATNSAGDSDYSKEASATTADSPPAAPSDLSAVALNGSKIDLAWTDNSNNETGFKIERKTGSGGTYSQIATVGENVQSYNDTGLAATTTYFYRVRATNAAGDSAYSNEASATTSEQQDPFGGVAWAIPGKIEAEDYDEGGEGVAYHDTTAGNYDGEYRTDDVDIKVTADTGGGYAIGVFAAGEWLEYTVNVGNSGAYDFKIRVGSKNADRTFHVEFNGLDVTGPINVPQMPDWDQYETVIISGIELSAGEQVMRVVMGSLDFMDLNWIEIVEPGVPNAPMDLTATAASSTQIDLAWTDNSNNETGFKIERKTGSGGTYSQIATVGTDVVSYSDTGLIDATTYFYRVRATNDTGDSAYSNEASATTGDSVPAAPSDLSAVAISESQIDLAWTDNSNNETGFKIERKTGSGGTYSQIATVGADVVSYSDTGLAASTTYFYRVRATNATGDSAFSNEASATTGGSGTAPAAPSDLIATAASSSQINLTWTDNATDETGFEIERKTGSGGTYAQIATPGANTTSFENTGLTADTTYFYRIRAVNASGESAWSNETSATTQTSTVGPRAVSKPPGSVDVFPGNNIQNVVNSNPAGTTFYIRAGVHRLQKITPRNGDIFVGELGAVLKGSKVLTNWNVSGSNYYVTGQTQGPGQIIGKTSTGFERGAYPEELFLDGKRLRHVGSISELAAGRWFFDYDNDRIYMRDNPTDRTVETSVTDYAFVEGASNVTIENLVIEQYATPGQRGTVGLNGGTSGWVVKFNAIGYNHGNGVKLAGTAPKLLNNYIYHQGMLGASGGGSNQLVEGNEFAFNAAPEVGYGSGYAAGTKWARSTDLIVRGNHSHDNRYAGLWTDGNNFSTLYEDNLIENNGHNGLFYEVSYSHIIRNNIARGNGFGFHQWFNGAGIFINTSQDAEVYGNTVSNNRNGIMMVGFNRGDPLPGNDPYKLQNISVYNNTVTMDKGRTGWYGSNSTPSTLLFNNNTYFLKGSTSYFNDGGGENDAPLTKSQWQATGRDLNSTFTVY